MKLHLGKMTAKELSQWFNVASKTYSNGRKDYMKRLKKFADFDEIYGGVVIKEIYIDTYVKNMNNEVEDYLNAAVKA